MFDGAISTKDVARYLGYSENIIREKTKLGIIPGFKVGSKWKYRPEKIIEFVEKLEGVTKELAAFSNGKARWHLVKRKTLSTGMLVSASLVSECKNRRAALREQKRKSMRTSVNAK